jgi:hypothetical protein
MVLMSAGKAARHQASIVNKQNICGGPKKSGLSRGVGVISANLQAYMFNGVNKINPICDGGNFTNPSQVAAKAARRGMF